MVIGTEIGILFILTLAVCLIGFKKYIWFISIGYGLSISAISIGMLVLFSKTLTQLTAAYAVLMALYGFRLGGFLAYRELKTGYNAKMKGEISDGKGMPFFVKTALWVTCALLYIMMMAPLIYRAGNSAGDNGFLIAGMAVSLSGILLEAVADAEKNKAKKNAPRMFCSKGLFAFVRCPNYLGELILWTGMFLSGFGVLTGAGQWIIAAVGYLGIVYIMFSGARRLEIRQDKNYGEMPEYRKYKASTPILLPFVPLYSVKKHKWLVG